MRVNGYLIEKDTAWLMSSGEIAIITAIREDDKVHPIKGVVHIRSNGELGTYYWGSGGKDVDPYDSDTGWDLVEPYRGRLIRFQQ